MQTTLEPTTTDRASLKIFISYTHGDGHIAPLLKEMLEVHNHRAWCAETDLDGGALFSSEIDGALRDADVLIVVLSQKSIGSKWVTREVAAFQAVKPDAPIVPLVLEPVDLEAVVPGLGRYQWIDFSTCLLTGFRKLFKTLGNDFLSRSEIGERRTIADRRVTGERRGGRDRRQSGTRQRMQIGFLLSYCRESRHSGLNPIPTTRTHAERIKEVLLPEARKYAFADPFNGQELSPRSVLDRAVDGVWSVMGHEANAEGGRVFRMLADDIHRAAEVTMTDRRQGERRAGTERRSL
jgi:hypothetical protein